MMREVRLTDEAGQCVCAIRDWLAQRWPAGALRWLDALDGPCRQIAEWAESFALAPEAGQCAEPLRQALFKTRRGNTYRALFVVRGSVVHVVSVRGGGQAPVDAADIVVGVEPVGHRVGRHDVLLAERLPGKRLWPQHSSRPSDECRVSQARREMRWTRATMAARMRITFLVGVFAGGCGNAAGTRTTVHGHPRQANGVRVCRIP